MAEFSGRTPPHNNEAEKGVLGSLLLACGDASEVLTRLRPEHFYTIKHQVIYEAIHELYDREGSLDMILLQELLERKDQLEEVGGIEFLIQLTESVQTSANSEHYAQIVYERALLRTLIHTCTDIVTDCYDNTRAPKVMVDEAEQRIFDLSEKQDQSGSTSVREAIKGTFDLIERWAKGNMGTPTGFVDLDRITNGLQPADLIIVAGRPSMGKTTISMNMALNAALKHDVGVAIFSLEVDRTQLAMNLLCASGHVSAAQLRSMTLSKRDWEKFTRAADRLAEANIFIDDSPDLTAMTIRAKARRLKSKHNIGMIIIDYLQLLESGTKSESRQNEISQISRSLKKLAREINVPVVTLSQLSRAVEQREDHRPRMSDLRESGSIEQDADLILLVYRDEYYHPDKEESKGKAEVIIAKHRNGAVGSLNLAFFGEYLRFENLAQYQEEY